MRGILVVAHGSRIKETEEVLISLLNMVKQKIPEFCIEYAFMEFSDKTLEKGIAALAEKKVSEIKVVPYFLFSGIHLKEDIPNMIKQCMMQYPEIKVIMGQSLGIDYRLADILADRIKE
ncbi:MAG: CbiX/SirB N-terminal domain-containing protein [Planctomycetaceae bacterium]|jgi:sirohydrochlorin ferrochelatase|nr:CbiX/SirB N-terminal domain-containing protein [Planctomycetaceae bacterium]